MKQVSHTASSGFLRLLADGVLLLLLLVSMVFSIQTAYGIQVSRTELAGFCVLMTVLMLVFYNLRRYRGLVMLVFACVYAAVGWHERSSLITGACMAVEQALNTLNLPLQMDTTWLGGTRQDVQLFLFMAVALLSVPIGWSVIRGRSCGLTILLTVPWILPALFLDVYPYWPAFLGLAAGWCVLLISGRAGREDPAGGARLTLICLPAVAAMLLLLTIALPRESYERPAWADAAREQMEATTAEWSAGSTSIVGQALSVLSGGDQVSTSLENAGPREFQNRVVLEVESDYTGRIYLRGASSAVYTGTDWEPLSDTVYASIGLTDDATRDPLNGYEPLNFPAMTASKEAEYYELNISYPSSLSGWMYTPYQLVTTPEEISDVTFEDDSHLERRFGIREKNLFFIPDALPDLDIMEALSWDAAQAEAVYRQFVYEHYLDVPENFMDVYNRWGIELMNEIGDTEAWSDMMNDMINAPPGRYSSSVAYASLVAAMLAMSTEYDLDTPYTPEGADFVDYFLNESHRGYCVHYATAGALILRLYGIPTRYVTGYTVKIPASGEAEVLDSDAHAWVEIYLDGYGWYPVEMTPSSGTGIDSPAPMVQPTEEEEQEQEPEPDEEEENQQEPEPEKTEPETNRPDQPETPDSRPETPETAQPEKTPDGQGSGSWIYWAVLVVVVAAALPVRRMVCVKLRKRRFAAQDRNRAVIAVYGYLKRLQPFGADPDGVLGDLARKAKFSQHKLSEEERNQAVAAAAEERSRLDGSLSILRRWWIRWVLGL